MEFKVAAKAAAASLVPAPANQGAQGRSRVSFVSGPAPTRTKALRAASNSATPVAKYALIGLLLARKSLGVTNEYCTWFRVGGLYACACACGG